MFSENHIPALPLLAVALILVGDGCMAQSTIVYRQGPVVLDHSSSDQDLNQDGVPDFRFTAGTLAGLPSPGAPSTSTSYLDTFAFNRNDYLIDSEGHIVLKQAGVTFGPETAPGENWGHRDSESQTIAYASGGSWPGFRGQPPQAFLGVRFLSNGAAHYGWIRFVVSDTNSEAFPVIADWAYESRTNTAIRAGAKPVSVPQASPEIRRSGHIRLRWQPEIGKTYQIQFKDNLLEPVWDNLDFAVVGTTTNAAVDIPITGTTKFFRVVEAD